MKKGGFKTKKLLAFAIFLVIVAIIYSNSINNEFVFDDIPLISENEFIKEFSNIIGMFGEKESGVSSITYRPVRFFSFMIDYAISGDNPVGYHISNMIYHALSGYLLFLILFFLHTQVPWIKANGGNQSGGYSKEYIVCILSVLVFLTHPVQVDSVGYISGRRDILSTLFFLLGFYYYLKYRYLGRKWYLVPTVLFYLTAISAKEMAITLPAVIIVFEIVENMTSRYKELFKDFWISTKDILKRYKYFVALIVVFIPAFTFYSVVYKKASHQAGWHGGSIIVNFLTVAKMWMTYIRLIFLPVKLSADYRSYPLATTPFELGTILSIAGVAAIFYITFKVLKKNKLIGFGLLWYIITLLPVSQIVPHHEMMAEHYLYLPIIGFVIALSALLIKTGGVKSVSKPVIVLVCIIITLYSMRVIIRNNDWKNEKTLWKRTVETDPRSHRGWFNLGNIYREEFLFESAIYYYDMSIRAAYDDETKAKSLNSIGAIFMKQQMYKPALDKYMESLNLFPEYPATVSNIAALYLEINDLKNAEEYVKKALELYPDFFEAKVNNAILLFKKGEKDKAKEMLKELNEEVPSSLLVLDLFAKVALEEGRDDDARKYFEDIILFYPNNVNAHFRLGNLYYKENFFELAINEFMQALKLNPGFYAAHLNLGNLYAQRKDAIKSVIFFENAAKVRPKASAPHLGLAKIYLEQLKDFEKAKKELEISLQLDPNQPSAHEINLKIKQLDKYLNK